MRELARARAAMQEPAQAGTAGGRLDDILEADVFGVSAERWLAMSTLAECQRWIDEAGTPAARLMARLLGLPDPAPQPLAWTPDVDASSAHALAASMDAQPDFELAPEWRGRPAETGALARCHRHRLVGEAMGASRRLLARGLARMVELAELTGGRGGSATGAGACGSVRVRAGDGLGWVETARGLLVHRARIGDGVIDDYRVLAPTEWNFHPRGPMTASVAGMLVASDEALHDAIGLAVQSLDPCVTCRIEVGNA
jgi:hypothetical protein